MMVRLALLGFLLPQASPDGVRLEKYDGPFAYGFTIVPPWAGGGKLVINLPEHLEYDSRGMGILRHNDKERRGTWEVSADGRRATLDVESPTAPGVRVRGQAKATGPDRIEITLGITNGGKFPLPAVKPLYCAHYRHLAGFPQWVDNFKHVYVLRGGKPVALADVPTKNPQTKIKGGTVAGCEQHDNGFAEKNGGLVESGVDAAVTAVESMDGKRKVVVAWTPGKSFLSNANIPCLHADPFYGTIEPGRSAEAKGVVLFTEGALDRAMAEVRPEPGLAAKYPGDQGIEKDPDVLFAESFETDSWKKSWQEISHPQYKEVESDPKLVVAGRQCLRLQLTPEAKDTGAGWMNYWWEGSDEAYLRFYFRLSKGGDWRNNKLLQLHGHPRGVRYGPGAGKKPTGFDTMCSGTGVGGEKGPPWTRVMLYTYWPGQKGPWGDNVMPNQGNAPSINEEEWTCYEVMVKLNAVGKSDGEQRLWINGALAVEQTGMEWRKTDQLVVNTIMLSTNTSEPPKAGEKRTVWIDGVVLARKYIGPLKAR